MSKSSLLSKSMVGGLLLTLLGGCATQTPYQPAEKRGAYGYTETVLTDNRYRVSFKGNPSTPAETAKDFALLRAGELTLQKGYDWFQVAARDNDSTQRRSTSVGTGFDFPAQTAVYQRCGLLMCDTVVSTSPGFSSGLDVIDTTTRSEYASSLEIVMGKNPVPTGADTYDARQLVENLRRTLDPAASTGGTRNPRS